MTTMFRNLFRPLCGVAFAAIVAATVAGCSDDTAGFDVPEQQPESGYITISLNCVEDEIAAASRAEDDGKTEPGDEDRHENLITTVTLCLWAKGADKPDTARPDYWQTFVVNKEQTAEVRVPLTPELKRVLFETTGATCNAFAAVNVTPPSTDFTIADLRNMAVGSTFATQRTQEDFTMDGDCTVSYDDTKKLATGKIDLHRSASKITLALNVDNVIEQTVVIGGNVVTSHWAPDYSGMRVRLNGGLSRSRLDPNLEENPVQDDFFDTPDNLVYNFIENKAGEGGAPDNGKPNPGGKNYSYIQERPFYTYPHRWSAEAGDYAATYMTLSIPWQAVNVSKDEEGKDIVTPVQGASWRTCYYQVPVIAADSDPLQLVRNVSYHVYLHVGILGSFIPDEPLKLENLEYSAAEWGTEDMDVTIPDVRYLVVDQNSYTVNNETSIAIPFYTSHKTIVTDATMTFYRYNFDDVGREMTVQVTMAQNEESETRTGDPVFKAVFHDDTKTLSVEHDLVMYEGMTSGNTPVSFTQGDNKNMGIRSPKTETEWNDLMETISYFRKAQPTETMNDVTEYSRVEFEITVQHEDMKGTTNFKEVIKITQYPGMYITTVLNYCPTTSTTFRYTGAQGNTFINGNYSGISYRDYDDDGNAIYGDYEDGSEAFDLFPSLRIPSGWSTSIGLSSGNLNFNPNMYLVTVTTLPEGTPYKIGDPRSKVINNNLESTNRDYNPVGELGRATTASNFYGNSYSQSDQKKYALALITKGVNDKLAEGEFLSPWNGSSYSYYYWDKGTVETVGPNPFYILRSYSGSVNCKGFKSATSIYPTKGKRNIAYYYPTREEDDYKYMIAPKFRICSSYAGTSRILNRELARRRAAAYQERGYAAGRWRLPTFGEVEFIMKLAAEYKIPRLFGTSSTAWWYWCAQGLVCVPSKKSGSSLITLPGEDGFELPTLISGVRDAQRARFVYDEWYWGEADLETNGQPIGSTNPVYTFTWGDREINFDTELH